MVHHIWEMRKYYIMNLNKTINNLLFQSPLKTLEYINELLEDFEH